MMRHDIYSMTGIKVASDLDYDRACRIAHFVRELGLDCGVTEGRRFVSEVVDCNATEDACARRVARRLVS